MKNFAIIINFEEKQRVLAQTKKREPLRDITDLVEKEVLVVAGEGGRSANYLLKADL